MRVVVIEGPQPIVTPSEIPGNHKADDPFVTAMIAAAQGEIDGPTGWLGRALGVQTLEARGEGWFGCLPYRPISEILSVTIGGQAVEGVAAEWDGVLHFPEGLPRGDLVIRYRAGYDGAKTGKVPANAKAAVILGVNLLKSINQDDIFLQQEQTNGVGARSRNVTPYVSETIEKAAGNLLAPLRVWI